MDCLPLSRPALVADYLAGKPELSPLYTFPAMDPDWETVMAARARYPVDRSRLVAALRRQLQPLGLSERAAGNLDALLNPQTFTVTTGQQAGLAGGPLYTWYKALSTLQLVQRLQQVYPGHRFVPVFWMAGEDHDADEVNHIWTGWEQPLRYSASIAGAVGRHVTEIRSLPLLPEAYWQHYQAHRTWGRAFQSLLQAVLGPYGMLVLDPDDRLLKEVFAPVASRELTEAIVAQGMDQANIRLQELGYPLQLKHRPLNLFYLTEGRRSRLIADNGHYWAQDTPLHWTHTQLLAELDAHPERFSPNAALRPVYQESVLPNLAYIGGHAELAYWLQLKPVFDALGIFYPVLLPRLSALALRSAEADMLNTLEVGLDYVLQAPEIIRAREAAQLRDVAAFQELSAGHRHLMEALARLAGQTDVTLEKHVHAQQARQQRFWDSLGRKLDRAAVQHHPARYERILRLQRQVQPYGLVQERVLGLPALGEDPGLVFQIMCKQLAVPSGEMDPWLLSC
ncbi:MAG: bacillithiol biosynthesis BshC [Bacteroidetes bacterium]|nr:bacillithiol biosynthesis BshC [Bacteroidota bacterium]